MMRLFLHADGVGDAVLHSVCPNKDRNLFSWRQVIRQQSIISPTRRGRLPMNVLIIMIIIIGVLASMPLELHKRRIIRRF